MLYLQNKQYCIMRNVINESNIRLELIRNDIKRDLLNYLKEFNYLEISKEIQIIDIKIIDDLRKVYTGPGFYIILLDEQFADNNCNFSFDDYTAIYRGHSYSVRDRLKSHLFNSEYNNSDFKNKVKYTVCLKFEEGIQGINLNEEPYCNYSWKVIIHKMGGSSKLIREQVELAFDEIYGRPFKSKER